MTKSSSFRRFQEDEHERHSAHRDPEGAVSLPKAGIRLDSRAAGLSGRAGYGGSGGCARRRALCGARSEEHTSELQSLMRTSYAVFCLKKKNTPIQKRNAKTANVSTRTNTNMRVPI